MMLKLLIAAAVLTLAAPAAFADPVVGQAAPSFTGTDVNGKTVNLSDFKGKTVVLEWTNNECPYVRKHYGAGNMQKTQTAAEADGAVWLTIYSSAEGKQGYLSPDEAKQVATERNAKPTDIILDHAGTIGHAYDARTTPNVFIIDANGTLVYAGAIDDKPTANPEDLKTARNYVLAALDDMKAGRPVATPESDPYGCSVKY
jgi:peroxiredoxin